MGPGIQKNGPGNGNCLLFFPLSLSFFPSSSPPDFCISHLARQQPRGPFFFCLGPAGFQRSMGGKSVSRLFANRERVPSSPFLPSLRLKRIYLSTPHFVILQTRHGMKDLCLCCVVFVFSFKGKQGARASSGCVSAAAAAHTASAELQISLPFHLFAYAPIKA